MRFSRPITVGPGSVWPDQDGGLPLARFKWLLVENRAAPGSGCDAYVSLTDRPVPADLTSWFMVVPAGTRRVRSIAGWKHPEADAKALRILNSGATAAVFWVETDDEPISDWQADALTLPSAPAGAVALEASASTAAGGALAVSIPAAAGLTSWITGWDCTLGIPAAAATVLLTVDGPALALNYALTASAAGGGGALVRFPSPIPAAAPDTAVTVNLPAVGGAAAVNALSVFGFQR